jgi:hypothetical protein
MSLAAVTVGLVWTAGTAFAYARAHRQRAAWESGIRRAREVMKEPHPYELVHPGDAALDALVRATDAAAAELAPLGFTPLCAIAMRSQRERLPGIVRALVDPEGTTCAYLRLGHPNARPALHFASYRGDERYLTQRARVFTLAEPQLTQRQHVEPSLPLDQMLAAHRAFARVDEDCVAITTPDQLLAALEHVHELLLRWRSSLPGEELLGADLRAIFGEQYSRVGPAWVKRLRDGGLPSARVVSTKKRVSIDVG